MTSQEAKIKYVHYLTVGRLKEELAKYSDDTLVVTQRIEDRYYEKGGWETINKPDPTDRDFEQQYSPVWGVCHYFDDKDCLFLDLHY